MTFRHLEELVVTRTGLQVRDRDREAFCGFVESRMKVLRLAHPEAYHQLLASDGNGNSSEWEQLVSALANNESYFFRDSGQFSLLKYHLLPELIAQNRQRGTLRLWSAGCSTGEEPYSLAILIDQLLPRKEDHWEVQILGTDIDGEALQRAREGVFGKWSFRAMPPDIQRNYFHPRRDVWEVDNRIRKMVTFRLGNLLSDPFPNRTLGICDMDLILCRNVFIYFDRGAVTEVVRKL
ncbi:MAG: protein-glutamate O-methyltransferase CheR, partial [Armatimonadetes bacterium]|nr:protein-glutamate O-methyltransferase CheR [Armatimonadota bacterium]